MILTYGIVKSRDLRDKLFFLENRYKIIRLKKGWSQNTPIFWIWINPSLKLRTTAIFTPFQIYLAIQIHNKTINFCMRCSELVKFNITMNFCYAFLLLFSVMRTTTTQISAMRWCCSLLWEQQRNNDAMLFSNENVVHKILSQNNTSRNSDPNSPYS